MIKSTIADSLGTKQGAKVEENALFTHVLPYPPHGSQKIKPYIANLATTAGATDMRVVGTLAAPISFYVQADAQSDRYITTLSFIIADAGAALNEFGNLTALTNGCRLLYNRIDGNVEIRDLLKSNFDFLRLSFMNPSFGDAGTAFLAQNVVGLSEAYLPVIDLTKIMPPFGIKLDAGTLQRITLEVRDNTTGVDGFDCIAYGFDRMV